MHIVIDSIVFIVKLLYLIIEGIIFAFLPASLCKQKSVKGEKVLITGSGKICFSHILVEHVDQTCSSWLWVKPFSFAAC